MTAVSSAAGRVTPRGYSTWQSASEIRLPGKYRGRLEIELYPSGARACTQPHRDLARKSPARILTLNHEASARIGPEDFRCGGDRDRSLNRSPATR